MERHNERDNYQLPDKRKAPVMMLTMACPQCQEQFEVDVFLGVPTHTKCPKGGKPILEPIRVRLWVNQRPAEALLVRMGDAPAQAKGRGGEVL